MVLDTQERQITMAGASADDVRDTSSFDWKKAWEELQRCGEASSLKNGFSLVDANICRDFFP